MVTRSIFCRPLVDRFQAVVVSLPAEVWACRLGLQLVAFGHHYGFLHPVLGADFGPQDLPVWIRGGLVQQHGRVRPVGPCGVVLAQLMGVLAELLTER